MKKSLFLLIYICVLTILFPHFTLAQNEALPPKREFRGVWIATVVNIDWPSKAGLPTHEQKNELIRILDTHQRAGINAIVFQVRPSADAFYAKSREPWSRFLTGVPGKAPSPEYDPLEFAITEAHSRGMELHAWFNPYRATFDLVNANVSNDHITKQKPEWFFTYSGKQLFNPGLPEVRDYITTVIMDVVNNYDVDGIHFDDYFYPYPDKNPLPDLQTFRKYGSGFSNIEDWRRENVNLLIEKISQKINTVKPHVKFGISPFGIWENKSQHPLGSETSGFSGYRQLYADARLWVEKGWVDYINPQIYFPFNYRAAAFEKLLDWWGDNSFGKHLYIGQAAYRATESGQGWREKDQLSRQVHYLRNNDRVQGSVFFSSKSLTTNMGGFRDALQYDLYRYKALPPTMSWLDKVPPLAPRGLTARTIKGLGVTLHWQGPKAASDGEKAYGYVIYRFEEGEDVNIENPKNILEIIYNAKNTTYTDDAVEKNKRYTYFVTSLDRLKNESPASNVRKLVVK
jgi:uncharacterized lipoprotein YddW (UPF0748 family)